MVTLRQHLEKRYAQLQLGKSEWEGHWRELSRYLSPRTTRFIAGDRQAQGNKRYNDIIDSTGTRALRTLVSGLVSGVTSPARPWFQLKLLDRQMNSRGDVRWWLEAVRDIALETFLKSNCYTMLPSVYGDLGGFGTSTLIPEPDPETVVRFRSLPLGSYCLGTDDTGRVNTCYREFQMTVAQLVSKFGKENCSERVRSMWQSGSTEAWIDVVHAIEPNADWDHQRSESKYKRFLSAYWEKGASTLEHDGMLSVRGFDEFPIIAPRWDVTGEDVYGSSPGMLALGDVKMLQLMQKRKLQALDKIVTPPMVADVSLKNKRASLLPGDITYVNDVSPGAGMRPAYQIVNFGFNELLMDIQATQRSIDDVFFKDLFLMISQIERTGVTATEIAARKEEKLMALGPVYMRLNDEMLDQLVESTINRLFEEGMLPPPPPGVEGAPLSIEYVSVMAQAMKSIGVENIERLMAFTGSVGSMFPKALHRVNADKVITRYAEMVGAPSDVLYDDEQVKAAAAAEDQQMRMAQMAELAGKGAAAAKDLGAAPTTGDNALANIVQAMRGAAPVSPVPGVQ